MAKCKKHICKDCGVLYDSSGWFTSEDVLGEKNVNWKGNDVGYDALHDWLNRHYGKPQICEQCPAKNLGTRKHQWANISGKYKRDRSDWLRLCAKCHFKYDNRGKALMEYNKKNKIRHTKNKSKSGYKNVKINRHGKFVPYISVNGKQKTLGSYKTPQQAYQVYKDKAIELYGTY